MNVSTTIDHEALREVVRKSRQPSWLRKHRWMAVAVGLQTVLASLYYGLIASPIYSSQSAFIIKSPGQKSAPTLSLASLIQTSGLTAGQEQTKEILQYIRSRSAVRDLEAQTDVRGKFSNRGADFLSRFPRPFGDNSFESFHRYYGTMVGAKIDEESGLAVLEVRAFTPNDAYELNLRLLNLSEALVNRLNDRAQGKGIAEAERRVLQAETRLRSARVALGAYRNQNQLLDPGKQATGVLEVSNRLVSEQSSLQAQLDLMQRVAPRNPAIPALRNRIAAIGRAIAAQNARAVGTPTGIASKLGSYENLLVEQEFATQMVTAANASLETARTDAQKQQFYLERVVDPNRPDDSSLPHRFLQVLTIFAASLCLYFIGWMLVVGILEHAPDE